LDHTDWPSPKPGNNTEYGVEGEPGNKVQEGKMHSYQSTENENESYGGGEGEEPKNEGVYDETEEGNLLELSERDEGGAEGSGRSLYQTGLHG
jgi:hypothetical protein